MPSWSYTEPSASGHQARRVTMTEGEILALYWDYWVTQMVRAGKLLMVTPENCIDDWIVVNWAQPAQEGEGKG